MRNLEHIDGVLGLIDREFGEMEQAGKFRGKDDIELAYKLMDIAKDAAEFYEKCCEMDEMRSNGGYSEYGRMYNPYAMGGMSMTGTNGRNNNMRMGNVNGYSNNGMYYNDYPRQGYSGMQSYGPDSKQEYLNHLRMKAENEPDDRTRDHLYRMIQEIEQMK